MPTEQSDAVLGEPAFLPGVGVVGDHEVAPRQRSLDVDRRACRSVVRGMRGLARAEQRLGRDARPIRALAADELALDDRDTKATFGQRAGAVLAR